MSKKHPQLTPMEDTVAGRRFFAIFGVLAIIGGLFTLASGRLHYQNYRGDNVFAPFVVLIGVLALIVFARKRNSRSTHKRS
jgi:hypothetical protein